MTLPNQIIAATDFSPASSQAVSVASRMARTFKAKLTLFHVFPYVPRHRYKIPVEWMVEIIRRDVHTRLQEVKNSLCQSGIDTNIVVQEDGAPALQILNFIQTCKHSLLVMGTHATSGMERFLLGSTAEEVLRQTTCPVITVGPHVSKNQNQSTLKTILFATDFSNISLAAAPFLLELKQTAGAHLRVLHVSDDHLSVAEEKRQFDPIQKAFQNTQDTQYVTLHGSNISQSVVDEAERSKTDLLVLGVRHTSEIATHLAPKIAFQIVAAAPCAVLTVSS